MEWRTPSTLPSVCWYAVKHRILRTRGAYHSKQPFTGCNGAFRQGKVLTPTGIESASQPGNGSVLNRSTQGRQAVAPGRRAEARRAEGRRERKGGGERCVFRW